MLEALELEQRCGGAMRGGSVLAAPQTTRSQTLSRSSIRSGQTEDSWKDALQVARSDPPADPGRRAAERKGLVEGDQALLAEGQPHAFLPHSTIQHMGTDNKRQISASGRKNLAPARRVTGE